MKFHKEEAVEYIEHKSHGGKGRPKIFSSRMRNMAD